MARQTTRRTDDGKVAVPAKMAHSAPAVRVDYPQEGEVLSREGYTFRIGTASGARSVEVSLDQGNWRPCREALGMWWHDWADLTPGEHVLIARTRIGEDLSATSGPRRFSVS
jgi:hypothetical protein